MVVSTALLNVLCFGMQIHEQDVIGLAHHPNNNVVVSWGFDGCLNVLKP